MTKPDAWGRKPKKPRAVVVSEHGHQVAFVQWVRAQYPRISELLIAIPNGGKRAMTTAKRLKAEGASAGFPDVFVFYPRREFSGLAIEFKRSLGPRGGNAGSDTTPEQEAWLERLSTHGYCARVAHGFDEAVLIFETYVK